MNTLKAIGIVLFLGAAALLGMVFYNYSLNGSMSYTSMVIAMLCVSIAWFLFKKK